MAGHETGITQSLVRQFALALPGAIEEPHFDMASFRVRGKIFVTAPPDEMQPARRSTRPGQRNDRGVVAAQGPGPADR
jgi:hypothetical protein